MYYAAYGSNLQLHQMKLRCPAAQKIGVSVLPNWQLVFRGVADIVPAVGHEVTVGLYSISAACQAALDHYESYPTLYRKQAIEVDLGIRSVSAMTYVMNPGYGYGAPSAEYVDVIRQGYLDWQISYAGLIASLQQVLDDGGDSAYKSPTWHLHGAIDRTMGEAIIARLKSNVNR
ncbi:MAG: gamma-glutamylcyclotransferase [Porticoccaceae bacterium]|nr:gamma-glutamylcyclotransferase [Porticoccaceae bacterium]